jgi:hypothetical protein
MYRHNQVMFPFLKEVLINHPLVLAMQKATLARGERQRQKQTCSDKHEEIDTVRIPLPIKVMPCPATEIDDMATSSLELSSVTKLDGSSYMILHMIGYCPMRTPPQQHSSPTRPFFLFTSRFGAVSSLVCFSEVHWVVLAVLQQALLGVDLGVLMVMMKMSLIIGRLTL